MGDGRWAMGDRRRAAGGGRAVGNTRQFQKRLLFVGSANSTQIPEIRFSIVFVDVGPSATPPESCMDFADLGEHRFHSTPRTRTHTMFKHAKPFSGFSVNDIEKARKFYHDTLELDVADAPMDQLE